MGNEGRAFLYQAGQRPSMFSAPDPAALPAGAFQTLRNVRLDDGAIEARPPSVPLAPAPFFGASPRGLWAGRVGGDEWMLGAWSDGTRVRIYSSGDGGATWTEATQDAGPYGNTRFESPAPFVTMALVSSPDLGDAVECQNGVDPPRVYARTPRYGATVAVQRAVDPPEAAADLSLSLSPSGLLALDGRVTPTVSGTGGLSPYFSGNFVIFGAFPDTSGRTTANGGSTATIVWPAPTDLSQATQLCVAQTLYGKEDQAWLLGFKVEIGNAGGWITAYDPAMVTKPSTSVYTLAPTGTTQDNPFASCLNVTSIDIRPLDDTALTAIDRIRLTRYQTASTKAGWALLSVFGGIATGTGPLYGTDSSDQSQASYRTSLYSSGSASESPGITIRASGSSVVAPANVGIGSNVANLYGMNGSLPAFEGVVLRTSVPIVPPSPAQRDLGVDRVKVYREDPGSDVYLFAFSVPVAAYVAGSWQYEAGRSATSYEPDTVRALSITATRYAPDSYALPVPIGTACAYANGRLHVGQDGGYAISEQNEPFRFRSVIEIKGGVPVPRSGVRGKIPGERVQGYVAVAGSALAASSLVMLTDRATYLVGGFDAYALEQPTRLALVGCLAPQSIGVWRDVAAWLDDRRQVRRLSFASNGPESMPTVSKGKVDDRTRKMALADAKACAGVSFEDSYYLFGRQAGRALADRAIVLDDDTGGWTEDENPDLGVACAVVSRERVVAQAHDGSLFVHALTGASGLVPVTVETGQIGAGPWPRMFFGRVGVLCGAQTAPSTMEIVRRSRTGETSTSSVSLAAHALGGVAWAWDGRPAGDGLAGAPAGLSAVAASVRLSASLESGTRIVSIAIETEDAGEGAE